MSNYPYDRRMYAPLSKAIRQMDGLACAAAILFTSTADDVIAGRMVNQDDIERSLDHLLDYCYDNECHKLYEKILNSIESRFPKMVTDCRSGYDYMWNEYLTEDDETYEALCQANAARIVNFMWLDAKICGDYIFNGDDTGE